MSETFNIRKASLWERIWFWVTDQLALTIYANEIKEIAEKATERILSNSRQITSELNQILVFADFENFPDLPDWELPAGFYEEVSFRIINSYKEKYPDITWSIDWDCGLGNSLRERLVEGEKANCHVFCISINDSIACPEKTFFVHV